MKNTNEDITIGERVNNFVQKNRKPIFISLGVIVLSFLGSVAAISLVDMSRKKALIELEEFISGYESLRFNITEDPITEDVKKLLNDLGVFAKKASGVSGGRAWSTIARIHGERKEWAEAEDAWLKAAAASGKTYLGPLSFFNAAVAAEEQGKNTDAIDLYAKSISLTAVFPAAPHAQFSIGRLHESLNNFQEAAEAYRLVLARWPGDATWASLAHSRIVALEAGVQ